MKKSLLAVAAMTAFAGAAQAQSSVTVYGILDVGFSSKSTTTSNTSYPGGNLKVTSNSFNSSNETASRLGFKGTEDLGGGTSAFFTVEMGLSPTESNSFTNMTNRQSFVGLSQKGLGNFAVGTQYTPMHKAVSSTDPGQSNATLGSVIYPAAFSGNNAQASADAGYVIRANNSLTLTSDKFAGFSVNAFASTANNNSTIATTPATATATSGGTYDRQLYGIGVDYSWKKLYAVAAFQQSNPETTLVGAVTAANQVAAATANNKDNQMYVGATYDFGILKAYAGWQNRKITGGLNSNMYAKRSAQQLGVRSFITPKIEGWASIGNGRYQAFGEGEPTANFNGWQLGSNYLLSKRTNLYAIYGQTGTSSTSGGTSQTTGAARGSQVAVGVRHTF